MSFRNHSSHTHTPSSARALLLLCAMSLLQFFIAIDVTVVNIALPSIGDDFGVSGGSLTWVVVGYTVTGGGLMMLGGRLSDLLGRRRTLLIGTSLFGAASLLAGIAPTFTILVIARLLQGAGEAIALPAAMSTIVLAFPEGPRRSRALAVWAAVASCGLVLGFVLSGVLTSLVGWRWIFLVSVPFIAVVIAAALLLVDRDRPSARSGEPVDLFGALLLTACPLLFTVGVVEAGEPTVPTWVTPAALGAAVLAGIGFVRVEARARNPLLPLRLLAHRGRVTANLTTMLLSGALSTSFLLFTFHLQDRLGLGPLIAGVVMLPLAIGLVALSVVVPRLLNRWGARTCVFIGLGSTVAAMILIAVLTTAQAGAVAMIVPMLLIAAGMCLGIVGLQYVAVSGVTEADAGTASGVQRAADQLGGSAGVAVCVGVGFSPALHSLDPFVVAAALAGAGLVIGAVIARWLPSPSSASVPVDQDG